MVHFYFFFFFKQKTAYEMRISDWSSDVCSSDLTQLLPYMLSSIHFSIEALPFRLTSSHAFAVQRDCPSRAPMLRTCWVRQKSFAKWKLKKTRRAIRPPFVLRPSTDRKSTRLNSSH